MSNKFFLSIVIITVGDITLIEILNRFKDNTVFFINEDLITVINQIVIFYYFILLIFLIFYTIWEYIYKKSAKLFFSI